MSKYSGYMDKVAMLDLGTREIRDYSWSDEERELYIGGRAMASKIMSDCMKGSENALSEENLIVITTGPLTGTGAPCSNHYNISAISPVTGAVSHASCGGDFGLYMKKAGYDAIIIKGKCSVPTWVEIRNSKVFFRKAGSIWGMKVSEAQTAIKAAVDEDRGCRAKCGMLLIGPAGENLVKYATVADGVREAEHCDAGAVFGFKNLKAIVVEGNNDISVAEPALTKANTRLWAEIIRSNPVTGKLLPKMGTMGFMSYLQEQGMLPTENWSKGVYAEAEEISGERFADKYNVACKSCTYCPIRCERSVMLDGKLVRGPELDVCALMGSNILNSDLSLIIRWNNQMHELGLDASYTANTLAWAMEANAEGVLKSELEFGRCSKISAAIEDIAYRRGCGAELAEGSELLGKKYGTGYAYTASGLEYAAVDRYMGVSVTSGGGSSKKPLTDFAKRLQEAVASSGQCCMSTFADVPSFIFSKPDGIASAAVKAVLPLAEPVFKILSLMPEQVTAPLPHFVHTKQLKYALGMDMTLAEYVEAGRRGLEAERELNEKFGVKEERTYMPKTVAAAQKAAKKSVIEKIKAKTAGIDTENIPVLKLIKKEA